VCFRYNGNPEIVAEIGLNHNGSKDELYRLADSILGAGVRAATIQIRELEFYRNNPQLEISFQVVKEVLSYLKSKGVWVGLAVGPVEREVLEFFESVVDFYKLLGITSNNSDWLLKNAGVLLKPKYFSVGGMALNDIKSNVLPYVESKDALVYTTFYHDVNAQQISLIKNLQNCHSRVSYGLHCSDSRVAFLAVGAGASGVFFYVGDKSKKLPDHDHAIDVCELSEYVESLRVLSTAMLLDQSMSSKEIEFLE